MDNFLTHLELIIPTVAAIMSLAFFTPKTRWLSYTTVVLAIAAELMPAAINITALLACVSCFAAMLFLEHLRVHNAVQTASSHH